MPHTMSTRVTSCAVLRQVVWNEAAKYEQDIDSPWRVRVRGNHVHTAYSSFTPGCA